MGFNLTLKDLLWKEQIPSMTVEAQQEALFKYGAEGKLWHVAELLEAGVDVNAEAACSPQWYVQNRKEQGLPYSKGLDLEDQFINQTLLMLAVQKGDRTLAAVLLSYGADPNQRNEFMDLPLVTAVQRNDLAMVKLLMAKGADPKKCEEEENETALNAAKDKPEILAALQAKPKKLGKAPTPKK